MSGLVTVVVLCGLGVAALYLVFVTTRIGQAVDTGLMHAVMARTAALRGPADRILDTVRLRTVAFGAVLAMVIGLLRRRPGSAAAALGVVLGANGLTELLKAALNRPWAYNGDTNSLPSGHVTAAAAVVAALLLVAAPAWRLWLALAGAGWVSAVSVCVVIAGWHRPSDVAAALLVVGGCTALAVLIQRGAAGRDVAGQLDAVGTKEPAGR